MRDAWWVAIWFCIWSLGVSAWAQEQERNGIFTDGFESGDACAWSKGPCETEPPPVAYPGTCGPGNVQENLSPLEDNGDGTCSWMASCSKGGTTLTARVTQPCGGGR